MRAILIATGGRNGAAPLIDRYPGPLLPLVDRPFLQHVIEYLARQGVRHFDIVLSHRPEAIERYFGDGTRWGCSFTYHLARDPGRPYRILRALDLTGDEMVLLGHADRLPAFDVEAICEAGCGPLPLVTEDDSGEVAWTGWALLPPDFVAGVEPDWTECDFAARMLALPADRVVERVLDTGSFAGVLASQRLVLTKEFGPLFLTGREVEPGVWLSRNVSLHPTARLTAPVYIGEDCRIGPSARLGPHAVVGRGCILGRDCVLTRSLIFPENYVGGDLELVDAIVERNRIFRGEGTAVEADPFLLGSLPGGSHGRAISVASRLFAAVLLVLAAPILLITAISLKVARPGPVLFRRKAVIVPQPAGARRRTCQLWSFHPSGPDAVASGELPPGLRSLLLVFLPALVNVVRGELAFVGVRPRGPREIDRLPPEWRSLFVSCKAGLITEESSRLDGPCSADERYAAEAYYAAAGDWRYDVRLLCGFLRRFPARVVGACPAV